MCRPGRRRDRRLAVAGRGAAGLDLRLELGHLLGAGQVLEQVVLLLQLRVALDQLFDLLLQHLHLLSHGVHQVALHQVLREKASERDTLTFTFLPPCFLCEEDILFKPHQTAY